MLTPDIETADGTLLVSAGYLITETLLERIRNFTDLSVIREPVYVESLTPELRAA